MSKIHPKFQAIFEHAKRVGSFFFQWHLEQDIKFEKFGKSKKGQRELLEAYVHIKENAIAWTSFWMSEKEIDEFNIYKATPIQM